MQKQKKYKHFDKSTQIWTWLTLKSRAPKIRPHKISQTYPNFKMAKLNVKAWKETYLRELEALQGA